MGEIVKTMDYKEAWEKCNLDYLVTTGAMYKHIADTYGEVTLIEFLKKDVTRYTLYFKGFVETLATILEKLAPGKIFEKKMREVGYEFQWFLGIENMEILELTSDNALGQLKYCPYEKAIASVPKVLDVERDFYCKYQCNVFMKEFCNEVLGFDISFEPQEVGCIYRTSRK